MSSESSEEHERELTPEELDEQSGEMLPDPLTEAGPPGEAPMNPLAPVGGEVIQPPPSEI
jgi:hypothetical protein